LKAAPRQTFAVDVSAGQETPAAIHRRGLAELCGLRSPKRQLPGAVPRGGAKDRESRRRRPKLRGVRLSLLVRGKNSATRAGGAVGGFALSTLPFRSHLNKFADDADGQFLRRFGADVRGVPGMFGSLEVKVLYPT